MAKIIQIIDVDSVGHKVRLDDGRVIQMPHGAQYQNPVIGEEVENANATPYVETIVPAETGASTSTGRGFAESAASLGHAEIERD